MKKEFTDINTFEKVVYEESFWTGKKKITLNGVPCTKLDRNTFICGEGEESKRITLQGNSVTGLKLTLNNIDYTIFPKIVWYEYVIAVFIIFFVVFWGNNRQLVMTVPIIGGAIGGALTGVTACGYVLVSRNVKNPIFKILIGIGFLAAAFLLCFLAGLIYIAIAAK